MVFLGDVGHVESRFGPVGDSVSVSARQVHGLRQTYPRLRNHFGRAQWNTYMRWVMLNLVLIRLETVLMSVQDRCTVCAKHTIGSEIVLDALD